MSPGPGVSRAGLAEAPGTRSSEEHQLGELLSGDPRRGLAGALGGSFTAQGQELEKF